MQTQSDTDANGSKAGSALGGGEPGGVPEGGEPPGWPPGIQRVLRAGRILLRSAEVFLWSLFFLAASLFLVLRYWVLPDVEQYRPQIVAAVSKAIGLKVTVERVSADWRGLRPQLELVNVRLFDAGGREALALPSVVNVIAWRSLIFLDLRLHSFEVDDLKLVIRRDAQGRIAIAGMLIDPEKKSDGKLSDWVLGQREIVVRNAEVEWLDDLRGAAPLKLTRLNFRLENDGDEHAAGFSAAPPRELGTSVEVRAELVGQTVGQPGAWNGRVFAEIGNTDLSAWRAWLDYPVDVRQGEGALRVWATLAAGKLRRVAADVALSNVVAQLGPDLPLLQLSSLHGRLSGRNTPDGFEIATRALQFREPQGTQIQPTSLRLSVERPAGKPAHGVFTANLLEFAPLARVAGALPLNEEVRHLLGELAPQGSLFDAHLDWTGDLPRPAAFTARTRVAGLGMKPWGRIPGFAGISGSLEASETRGVLQLAAKGAEVDLPRLFSDSHTALDTLSGQVAWESAKPGDAASPLLRVSLANLAFSNRDLAGTAFGSYAWTGQGPGTIDLSAQLSRADAKQVPRYMPLILSAGLRHWLDDAIVAGTSDDVRLRLRGDLREFPFLNPAKGQFQVTARVRNGTLNYVPGWPQIEGIDADLLFERGRAEFVGRKGTIFGAYLSGVRVAIPNLNAGQVSIAGQAEGPTADFLRYIQQTPVRRMISGATDAMQATGRGQLKLKLDLPLADPEKTKVAGQYQFTANNLTVDARLPQIERATGRVEFSDSGIAIRDVRGVLFGGPVAVSGATRTEGGVLVTARGDATVAGLRPVFDHPWRRFLSGGAPYTANVLVNNGSVRVSFETLLNGVASDLPPPLAKSAQESMPLRVDIAAVEGGDRISVSLAKFLNAEFQRRKEGDAMVLQRTGVGLNQATRLPERNGLVLAGTLPGLNLDAWLPLLSAADGGAPAPANAPPSSSTVELKLDTLDAFGKRLNVVALRAGADAFGWQANVAAKEMTGDIAYRMEGRGKLTARLSHFTPPGDTPGARPAGSGDLPAVDLIAERFNYRGRQLGRVEIVAQPDGPNWRIERIANVNPEAALAGKGLWITGANSRTSIDFTLSVNDAGKYLDRVGTPNSVKGGTAKVVGALTWAGDPLNIHYPSLAGQVSLEAENGQFLEIEPGIGKLVSLMSLQMLPRRIALDFRDVFSKGFAFDRITSALHIEKGVINTRDFKMRGPAAEVDIDGDADIAAETQDLKVRVVPALGDSASTLLGLVNPLYGVATFIAQKLLKNPIGNIFAFEYSVTGKWADPKVEKLAVTPVEPAAEPGEPLR